MKYLKSFESINILKPMGQSALIEEYIRIIDNLDDYLIELSDEGYNISIRVDILYLKDNKRVPSLNTPNISHDAINISITNTTRLTELEKLEDSDKIHDCLTAIFNRLNLGSNFGFMFIDTSMWMADRDRYTYRAFIWNKKPNS